MKLRAVLCVAIAAGVGHGLIWPVLPNDSVQPLGNNWGNYQYYTAPPAYMHEGIDIMTPGRVNAPVVSVSHGWVKTWGTDGGALYWRIAVCDSPPTYTDRAPGWQYAHLDPNQPHKDLGDEVFEGDTLGYIVDWPPPLNFDHLHFARISDTGEYWMRFPMWAYVWFLENPLPLLEPRGDTVAPVIADARGGDLLAFCLDQTSDYLDPDSLHGKVDIVAKAYDCSGYSCGNPVWDKLAPFRIEHMIRDDDSVIRSWTLSVEFSNVLYYPHTEVVYKCDDTCHSLGNWYYNEYYYIITNTDGDSIIEFSDSTGAWNTLDVENGDYWVFVRASDHVGNSSTDSMLVTVRNPGGVAGRRDPMLVGPFAVYPSPGRGPVAVSFALEAAAHVRLRVIDPAGRVVAEFADRMLERGPHRFDAGLPAGVYLVEAVFDRRSRLTRKAVVTE